MTDSNKNNSWSDTAINNTIKALNEIDIYPSVNKLCFKHIDGNYGYIKDDHFLENKYALHTHDNELIGIFLTAKSLVDAGWVLD